MRLKNYITEEIDAIDYVERDCQPFLREAKDTILWRGIHSREQFLKIKPRRDRKAKDTPQAISDVMDVIWKQYIGWKPRSEGVFTTTSLLAATTYSEQVYRIFPIGKFRYIYFDNVSDTYTFRSVIEHPFEMALMKKPEFSDMRPIIATRAIQNKLKQPLKQMDPEYRKILMDIAQEKLINRKIRTDHLSTLKDTRTEVTLFCKEYYAIRNQHWKLLQQFRENK